MVDELIFCEAPIRQKYIPMERIKSCPKDSPIFKSQLKPTMIRNIPKINLLFIFHRSQNVI